MAYNVSTADVESRWRPLSDAESDVAATLLEDATTLIDVHRPLLAAAVAAGTVPERIVIMTAAEAVIRVLSNPDRLSQQSITADGGISIGWQFEAKVPTPRLRVSDLDFESIDESLEHAGISTGRRTSTVMRASTRWGLLYNDVDDESERYLNSGLLVFPGLLDTMTVSDSYSIILQ